MSRMIYADALMSAVMAQDVVDKSVAKRLILQAPTVDAVRVVRCKECRHRCGHMDGYTECDKTERIRIWHPDDWYCADGDRKNDADN